MTQVEVAERAGIERFFYMKLENARHSILLDRVWDLADALGVRAFELFEPPREQSPSR